MFRGVPVPSKALKRVFITSIERQKGTIFIKFASIVLDYTPAEPAPQACINVWFVL